MTFNALAAIYSINMLLYDKRGNNLIWMICVPMKSIFWLWKIFLGLPWNIINVLRFSYGLTSYIYITVSDHIRYIDILYMCVMFQ